MPDNVVGETNDLVACSLGHLGEPFRFGLVFECIGWEVNTCPDVLANALIICLRGELTSSVDIGLDKNAHATNTVELEFLILVLAPVSLEAHMVSARLELLVAYTN